MKHTSVRLETPCEFINITPVNPLISKCQIKVCYVEDEPNRNSSIITKEVAKNLANSLPGSPIVGYYNSANEDFEEHNRIISVSNGKFEIVDTTRPYGFVDLNAKVWFQKFLDDGVNEREYLMTEGYLWTGQYPECQRIIDKGNNQSMELSDDYLDATWTKDDNGNPQFFIINEAIISKLCILGEEFEPCFEGAQITNNIEFSFNDSFKTQLFAMMNELKELLEEGGAKEMFNVYTVEIGEALWNDVYSYLEKTFPDGDNYCSIYSIEGVYEEGIQKFVILRSRSEGKYYRLNFDLNEENGFAPSQTLIEVSKTYVPLETPQFALEEIEAYQIEYAKKRKEEEDKNNKNANKNSEDNTEEDGEKKCSECGKPLDECECEDKDDEKKKKSKYNLEDIVEYNELKEQYDELMIKFNALETDCESLKVEIEPLRQFKLEAEKKAKMDMINQFYMLSDEDKADVLANIDTYSVDDIEAKLSIICVRNKVSFNLDEDKNSGNPTVYNLNNGEHDEDAAVPAWIKSLRDTAKSMN